MSIPDRRGGLCKGPVAGVVRALRDPEMAFKESGAFLSDGTGRLVASDPGLWWRGSLWGSQELPVCPPGRGGREGALTERQLRTLSIACAASFTRPTLVGRHRSPVSPQMEELRLRRLTGLSQVTQSPA